MSDSPPSSSPPGDFHAAGPDRPSRDGAPAEEEAPVEVAGEIEAARAEIAALGDRLRRAEASFINEARQIRRRAEEEGRFAIEAVLLDLLPVLDALASARARIDAEGSAKAVEEGLALVSRQVLDVLKRHGVEPIPALGLPFNPLCHEAMLVVDGEPGTEGIVRDVLRAGYTLHGRVVRPAQVSVTSSPSDAASAASQDDDVPAGVDVD